MRPIPYYLTAAVAGLLFGAGLYVSQMVDPYKVLRFLDITSIPTGGWDPSLAFVMAGGLAVMFIAVRVAKRRPAPLFDSRFHEPEFKRVDAPLVVGSVLFGIGWGMSGICPGPAISLIGFWPQNLLIFLIALFAGSYAGAFVIPSGRDKRLALAR
ncbi:MAG TPA: YeeE/YedE family protein [Alphaproteobacteria bacterium]|nr:YeeE/YedE family protein [Alphaproteobacteria bacterium]